MPTVFVALCAKNALEGFKRFATYKKLICPLLITVEESERVVSIHMCLDIPNSHMPRFTLLNEQLIIVSLIRNGVGEDSIKPIKISGPYHYSDSIVDYLGIKPEYSVSNVISFRYEDLLVPFITQNNVMWDYLEPELKKRLETISGENTFINLLEKTLYTAISSGKYMREDVAKSLGVSVRTMQRKLSDENTTFKEQVQRIQKMLALYYLKNDELSIGEITYLLGYKEQASFSRLFKKWTGNTITEYKNNVL